MFLQSTRVSRKANSKSRRNIPLRFDGIIKGTRRQDLRQGQTWVFKDGRRLHVCVSKIQIWGVWTPKRIVNSRKLVPSRCCQATKANFMYTCHRFRMNRGRSRVPYFSSACDDGEERIWKMQKIIIHEHPTLQSSGRFGTPFSTEINPRHPITFLLLSFTRVCISTWSFGRNSTMTLGNPSPARKTSARGGRPSCSSWESVTRYNARGTFLR